MKQGTMSVLFGCHSPMHSLLVIRAWKKIYGRWPCPWQVVCIFLHDIGHWGKDYLDDYEQKKQHGILGARIAGWLFGQKGCDLIHGHNLYNGTAESALLKPDKFSYVIAPIWWIASTAVFEPKLQWPGCTKRQSALLFKAAMRENWERGLPELGHEIYLKQWDGRKELSDE